MAQRPIGTPIIVGSSNVPPPRLASLRSPSTGGPTSPSSLRSPPPLRSSSSARSQRSLTSPAKRRRTATASPEPVPLPRLKNIADYTVMDTEEISKLPIAYFCRDTRHGVPTQAFIDRENEALRQLHEAKQRNSEDEDEETAAPPVAKKAKEASEAPSEPETPRANKLAAQVRIVDGQVVIDTDSLVVNRSDMAEGMDEPLELVDESARPRFINSMTYVKRRTTRRAWSPEETNEFYLMLRKFGSDFEMIAAAMPDRNRYDIRNKFKKEERKNPLRVTDALLVRNSPSSGPGFTVQMESEHGWKFTQCFGDKADLEDVTEADIISTVEFDHTGDYLATGDKGGR
ncbi:hypothetical protein IWW54_005378, partial [Coemansia sp. RSA 2705]